MAPHGRRLESHLAGTMAVQQGAEDKLGRFSSSRFVPPCDHPRILTDALEGVLRSTPLAVFSEGQLEEFLGRLTVQDDEKVASCTSQRRLGKLRTGYLVKHAQGRLPR